MSYKIIVVGGGTAGVMAATYFKSYWGNLVDVTMIYDHKKPGIGVGESLTPIFDNYLKTVGITTIELIQNCNATIKLGLKFKNWTHEGSEWHHSFPIKHWRPLIPQLQILMQLMRMTYCMINMKTPLTMIIFIMIII